MNLYERVRLALARRLWKSRCKVCGTVKQAWRMMPHWQPLNIPGTVAHRGGSICKTCHKRLCGRPHRQVMCAKDLGVAILPTWNWPHRDTDAILDEEWSA